MRPTILGAALVHGLRQVDSELIKPRVRKGIERDVTDIAKGRRTLSEVVASALGTFREKYRCVRDGMPKIIEEFEWKRKKKWQWKEHDRVFEEYRESKGKGESKGK